MLPPLPLPTSCGKKLIALLLVELLAATLVVGSVASTTPQKYNPNAVRINKCCERFEVMLDGKCTVAESINASEYAGGGLGESVLK